MASFSMVLQGEFQVFKVGEQLTADLVPDLQAVLKAGLKEGARAVRFDFAQTEMLDSSGIGLLIASANSLARIGGRMEVVNVSPDIVRLLQSMRLEHRLHVSGQERRDG